MSSPDFRTLVGNDHEGDQERRLRRAHDLLVAAGPPPELPPTLATPPTLASPRRAAAVAGLPAPGRGRVLALAFSLAVVGLVAGYVFGLRQDGFETSFSVDMRATRAAPGASAKIDVGPRDSSGNWPLRLKVRGLRTLPAGGYYELLLTRPGRRTVTCGTFRVHAGTTEVRLNAPYEFGKKYGWIVTTHRGERSTKPLLRVDISRA